MAKFAPFVAFFAAASAWTYEDQASWATTTPLCGGLQQSPIDIALPDVRYDPRLSGLSGQYRPFDGWLANTNHGLRVGIDLSLLPSTTYTNTALPSTTLSVSGGALGRDGSGISYKAHSFHFHFGQGMAGSEHTIDGYQHPLELHLIHWDESKYHDVGAALYSGDPYALGVIGVMYEVDDVVGDNPAFDTFLNNLLVRNITNYGHEDVLVENVDLNQLFPPPVNGTWDMYTYPGSLTVPGCFQTVIWNVLLDSMTVSSRQLAMFQSLKLDVGPLNLSSTAPDLGECYRAPQPMNGRVVRTSSNAFPPLTFEFPNYVRLNFKGYCEDHDLDALTQFLGAQNMFYYPFDNYEIIHNFTSLTLASGAFCYCDVQVNQWSAFYQNDFNQNWPAIALASRSNFEFTFELFNAPPSEMDNADVLHSGNAVEYAVGGFFVGVCICAFWCFVTGGYDIWMPKKKTAKLNPDGIPLSTVQTTGV